MRFQPGHSGNPAGRPPGSLNKKTLAAKALMDDRAEEIVQNLMDRAKNGEPTAMRLCMDRLAPTGRNRPVAIDLPVVKTPEDAEAALVVVLAELADGKLTIAEVSALITAIDRMLRLAERMWNFARARRYAAARDAILLDEAETAAKSDSKPARTAEKPGAPLYSPVNSRPPAGAEATRASPAGEGGLTQSAVSPEKEAPPLPRAA